MLLRQKRTWIIDSFIINESYAGPFPYTLGRINVEKSLTLFQIHGQGVDEEPKNILQINNRTGILSVLGPVDYEKYKVLKLTFQAYDLIKGDLDTKLGILIDIIDSNDNPPKFAKEVYSVFIEESTLQGAVVVTFTATDADSTKDNRDFSFHIASVTPEPQDLEFYISQNLGVGTLSFKGCLDHEKAEKYVLLVEARDKGKPEPLSSTCTIIVNIRDENNHLPVITEHTGPGKVEEGKENVLVSRLKVTDEDKDTKAWKTTFQILGDTDKNFQITTDPETNEGLLYVVKQLNYEEVPVKNLTITAENEMSYFSCKVVERTATGFWIVKTEREASRSSSYRMKVFVVDVNEGPVFDRRIQQVSVDEDVKVGKYLTTFTARDPDITRTNTLKYIKGEDPADWITVDPNTGTINTSKVIDRESSFVNNGVYIITIYAVDNGKPPETGTATLSIQIRDKNDNAPYLVVRTFDMCQSDGPSLINITASDLDEEPNSGPFTFKLLGDVEDKWSIDPVQGYSVNLVKKSHVHFGYHELQLEVSDLLGQVAVQHLSVTVCDCSDASRSSCKTRKATGSTVGVGALGVTFFCVILLAALLLFAFLLSTKKLLPVITDDTQGELMKSNTESPGTDCVSMGQAMKIMAASSAMGIRHQQGISQRQYLPVQNTLTLRLQNLRALELGDYEPYLYADEGGSEYNYELDDLSIPEVSFDLDSNLDYRFLTLASICMPSIINADTTKTAAQLNTSSQLTYQETLMLERA
ncbi:cadherin-like protein 26 [Xenentodon cancila]